MTKNLSIASLKKFQSFFLGLFSATYLLGPVAVPLEISGKLHGHYPVFYVLLLHKYLLSSDVVEPPAPVIVEDSDEYKVEALIAHS